MILKSTRLTRFEEKAATRRLFLNIFGIIILILLITLAGIPALVRFSIFISDLRDTGPTNNDNNTILPFPPRLETSYEATNSASITITGFAQTGLNIEIFKDNEPVKKLSVGTDGQFIISDIGLSDGNNVFTAIASDNRGNKSEPSLPLSIIYKNTPPDLEVAEPYDNQNYQSGDKDTRVVGKTNPGNNITVNNRFVLAKSDGSFELFIGLTSGENIIRVVASDSAGNQTIIERKVNYSP